MTARFIRERASKRGLVSMLDTAGITHLAGRVTKKEVEYIFRLADTVRAIVGCGECLVEAGQACVRKKDQQPMSNHSRRLTQARLLFDQRILPKLDRMHMTLCTMFNGSAHVVFNPADGRDVDCMSCLVIAAQQGDR